jgi:hypothetical protein
VMGGDYPSTDFHITVDGGVRRIVHIPTGMTIGSNRLPADPILVSSTYIIRSSSTVMSTALGRLPKRRFDIFASG